ncbi:hypothetical protein A2U01_0114160, partial [Trifolium medium]|nr:hypothetical protein [Trifolium medium]
VVFFEFGSSVAPIPSALDPTADK